MYRGWMRKRCWGSCCMEERRAVDVEGQGRDCYRTWRRTWGLCKSEGGGKRRSVRVEARREGGRSPPRAVMPRNQSMKALSQEKIFYPSDVYFYHRAIILLSNHVGYFSDISIIVICYFTFSYQILRFYVLLGNYIGHHLTWYSWKIVMRAVHRTYPPPPTNNEDLLYIMMAISSACL